MGGSANEEGRGQLSFANKLSGVGNGNTLFREVDTGSTNGPSNVETVVHQNATRSGCDAKGFLNQVRELAAREMFLANLNPIHAGGGSGPHFL